MMDLPDRIFNKICFEPNTGCWLWTAARSSNGYGAVRLSQPRRMAGAHRIVYEHLVGPVPDGLVLDHICRVRRCVNPQHLRVVNHLTNSIENSSSVAALNAVKTHCAQGHLLDASNTYPRTIYRYRKAARRCRICARARLRTYYQQRCDRKRVCEEVTR